MTKKANPLAIASKAIDPTLDALFATSSGPVQAPSKSRYAKLKEEKHTKSSTSASENGDDDDDDDDEELSEISEELDYEDEDEDENEDKGEDKEEKKVKEHTLRSNENEDMDLGKEEEEDAQSEDVRSTTNDLVTHETTSVSVAEAAVEAAVGTNNSQKERKRKRKNDNEDLEGKYLAALVDTEETKPLGKRQKGADSGEVKEKESEDDVDNGKIPLHETLAQDNTNDVEKAARTVFVANVSTEAISSKAAKRTLMKHLASVLDENSSPPQKLESLRFRSVAFSTGSMPKRAAFITKALMDSTTKSTNAYAVFSTAAAARKVATELNGSQVLDRHIRVDSVAHPSPMDHRRCVFVGNLGFVDDETVLNTTGDGETVQKKRNKVPSDVEEGLWRTFSKQGKVENVRVVRDPKTRVGKGFAYVQFYDINDVEAALLLNEKKFPPMLPRSLRVTRAKDPRKTALSVGKAKAKADAAGGAARSTKYRTKATPEQQAAAGRASKLLGKAGAAKQKHTSKMSGPGSRAGDGIKTPEDIIFEGRRASSKDGLPKDLKMGKKGKGKGGKSTRPKNRGARRAAAWNSKK